MVKKKTCFIISSIGKVGEDTRKYSNQKLNHVFRPTLENLGYLVSRADEVNNSGLISKDIIKHLKNDDLVLADVSDENPNVFYELAIRNVFRKPVILFKKSEQRLPFDIQDKRAIPLDMTDPDVWIVAIELLKKYVKESEIHPEIASESIMSEFFVTENNTEIDKLNDKMISEIQLVHKKLELLEPKPVSTSPPSKTETLYDAGIHLGLEGNHLGAITCFEEVIKKEESFKEVWHHKGVSYYFIEDYQNAANCFEKMFTIQKNHKRSLFFMALTLNQLKKYNESLEYSDKIKELKTEPDDTTFLLKAMNYADLKDFENGLIWINKSLELRDDFSVPWKIKSRILSGLGKTAESKECLKKYHELEKEEDQRTEQDHHEPK